jgi:hypothetical protein
MSFSSQYDRDGRLHFVCRLVFDMHDISEIDLVFRSQVSIIVISSFVFLIFLILALEKPTVLYSTFLSFVSDIEAWEAKQYCAVLVECPSKV